MYSSSDSTSNSDGYQQGWLTSEDGTVLASITSPTSLKNAMKGSMFTDKLDTALYFPSGSLIHTFGVRFPLDVAVLSRDNRVKRTISLKPNRLFFIGFRHGGIIEAEAGSFEQWGLTIGLDVKIEL